MRHLPFPSRKSFKAWVSIRLAGVLSWWVWITPRPVIYRIFAFCGLLVYHLFPTYRANVSCNLRTVLGDEVSERKLQALAKRVFRNSAINFCDLLLVPRIPANQLRRSVQLSPDSLDHLRSAMDGERGAVIVTAHFGAFDYVGQILMLLGYPFSAITMRTVPEFIDIAVSALRSSHGVELQENTPGGIRRLMYALRRGQMVAIAADRDFNRNGRPVTFFGQSTTLPPGPARIARQADVPIVAILASRRGRGFRLTVGEPFRVERTDDPEGDLQRALERIVQILEREISRAPDQWVMFQRVWPDEPAPAVQVFPVGSPLGGEILGRGSDETGPLTAPPEPPTDRRETPPTPSPAQSSRPATRRE